MKRIVFFMLIIIAVYVNVTLASVGVINQTLYYTGITINIDNKIITPKDVAGNIVDPFIMDDTVYLPVRAISNAFEKEVLWDGVNYSVYISESSGEKNVATYEEQEKKIYQEIKKLNYNNIKIYINEELIEPKDANGNVVEPFIIDGTTYLPVRAVAEAFNKNVNWDGTTNTVLITTKDEENDISKIENVVVKIIDNTLCAEVTLDKPINTYNSYTITEGKIKAEPYLNMREDSNTNSTIIGSIPNETLITIKDVVKENNKDAWYEVSYASKTGYISADYVSINPTRLVIDLEDTSFNIDTLSKDINYKIVKAIRFGNQGNNISRIVLDLTEMTKYNVVTSEDKTKMYFALNDNFKLPATIKGEEIYVATTDDKIYLPEDDEDKNIIDNEVINSGDIGIEDEDNSVIIVPELASVDSIKYSSSTNKTKISIDGEFEYTSFVLTNPDRVVIDISGAILNVDGPKEINPNNKNLTAIRFSQNEEDVVRIVFDVNAKTEYEITEKSDELIIELKETTYKNIDYIKYETYSTLVLKDTDIDYFETEKSSTGNKYYITYSSRKFKSGTGTIEVYDDYVEEIVIKTSKITIYAADKYSYSIKQNGDDVIIKISEQEIEEKVILIDAGHGGTDPGACNGSVYEKVYNLKIALKLYEMLKETDGIDVRISRTDDVYIDREGRLEFVLDNDDADLVVSIHNNSLANKNYQGSMVLFYNKPGEKEEYGITSKEFATIVKNNLIEELGTIDRGAVSRDDLWILTQNNLGEMPGNKITNIPSILCEVIFISNDEEAARLQTDSFQQKTAQAIYDGIIEAISIMDNK